MYVPNRIVVAIVGGIDPETEKEYRETKERYDFLSAQTSDLDRAIKSLEEIIYDSRDSPCGGFGKKIKVKKEETFCIVKRQASDNLRA